MNVKKITKGVKWAKEMSIDLDLDSLIASLKDAQKPSEKTVAALFNLAIPIFDKEPNVLRLDPPLTICGDSHGQLYDSLYMFEHSPPPPETKYLFLGDYVDRGYYSIELLCLFVAYKIKYPDSFFMLRGNHETSGVNCEYGYKTEIEFKYNSTTVYDLSNKLFQYLPIAAIVDKRIFCCHGGLCPGFNKISQIEDIERRNEPELTSIICNILWSDPSEYNEWARSERRSGYLFGPKQATEFLDGNNLEKLVRSHELVDGYREQCDGRVITVWNAPNYCYVCGNRGSFLRVGKSNEEDSYVVFDPMPDERRRKPEFPADGSNPYFL